jgi:hypothetical protein
MASKKKMKRQVTRHGKLVGGFVPKGVAQGILTWISQGEERDQSTFLREAAREKLRREGIPFDEKQEVPA